MNNISKKLLTYSLLSLALTGCNNKPQDQEKEKFHQTFKEVLTNDDIDQKVLEKISEFFNNTENSYETFIQIVNMSEDKLSIMHEKIDDQKIKKFINFVTMIKLTALFSEVSTINEEIQKDTEEEEIVNDNDNIKIETESSNQSILNDDYDEKEEHITNETTVNEKIKEVVTIEEDEDDISTEEKEGIEENEIKAIGNEDNELLIDSNDYDENENDESDDEEF